LIVGGLLREGGWFGNWIKMKRRKGGRGAIRFVFRNGCGGQRYQRRGDGGCKAQTDDEQDA
jgi:hypothetical protein